MNAATKVRSTCGKRIGVMTNITTQCPSCGGPSHVIAWSDGVGSKRCARVIVRDERDGMLRVWAKTCEEIHAS